MVITGFPRSWKSWKLLGHKNVMEKSCKTIGNRKVMEIYRSWRSPWKFNNQQCYSLFPSFWSCRYGQSCIVCTCVREICCYFILSLPWKNFDFYFTLTKCCLYHFQWECCRCKDMVVVEKSWMMVMEKLSKVMKNRGIFGKELCGNPVIIM